MLYQISWIEKWFFASSAKNSYLHLQFFRISFFVKNWYWLEQFGYHFCFCFYCKKLINSCTLHAIYINWCTKAHSLSKKFCTMICFSKNEQLMSALAGWKGLVRMICFSKNEDRAELFTQWMDFSIILKSHSKQTIFFTLLGPTGLLLNTKVL